MFSEWRVEGGVIEHLPTAGLEVQLCRDRPMVTCTHSPNYHSPLYSENIPVTTCSEMNG